jgi:hypothetical protein
LHGADVKVAIVDIDSWSFRLARQYFGLPPTVDCHAVDGAAFLRASAHRYDAIVLDAYDDNLIPPQFATPEFLDLAKQRLAPLGIFITNLHLVDDNDPAADRFAAQMGDLWADVRLLDTPGKKNRNTLAMAGSVAMLQRPVLRVAPSIDAAEIARDLERLVFRGMEEEQVGGRHLGRHIAGFQKNLTFSQTKLTKSVNIPQSKVTMADCAAKNDGDPDVYPRRARWMPTTIMTWAVTHR